MIGEALFGRLTGAAGVAALVGSRVYPRLLPQDPQLPALVIQRVSEQRETAMGADPGIVRARTQVSCWATTVTSSRDLAEQVRQALERYRGTLSGTEILDVFVEDVREMESELVDGVRLERTDLDFEVIYRE